MLAVDVDEARLAGRQPRAQIRRRWCGCRPPGRKAPSRPGPRRDAILRRADRQTAGLGHMNASMPSACWPGSSRAPWRRRTSLRTCRSPRSHQRCRARPRRAAAAADRRGEARRHPADAHVGIGQEHIEPAIPAVDQRSPHRILRAQVGPCPGAAAPHTPAAVPLADARRDATTPASTEGDKSMRASSRFEDVRRSSRR